MCSYGELEMLEENDPSLDPARGTATQSGSSLGVKGFDGRWGFSMAEELSLVILGGAIPDLAILPLSSHHLWRSELAGGRPGSMASYPIRSSSSSSSRSRLTPSCPMSALRRSYSSRLIRSRRASSTILTVHWKVAYTGRWSENLRGAELYAVCLMFVPFLNIRSVQAGIRAFSLCGVSR
jgi:hypothetical protein